MYLTLQMSTAEIQTEVTVPPKKAKASSSPLSKRKPVPFISRLPEKQKKSKDVKSYSLQSKAPAEKKVVKLVVQIPQEYDLNLVQECCEYNLHASKTPNVEIKSEVLEEVKEELEVTQL